MTVSHAEYTALARALRSNALEHAQRRAAALLRTETYTGRDSIVIGTMATIAAIGRNGFTPLGR